MLLIHGDAAFAGQGIVAGDPQPLGARRLLDRRHGPRDHDNQVGFTTDPADRRSTRHSSDLAKGFDTPIVHVNADDPEGCARRGHARAHTIRLTHHRDVVIDLVGYRRFGHNEPDEPTYTQPLMDQRIREHPTVRELLRRAARRAGSAPRRRGRARSPTEVDCQDLHEAHERLRASSSRRGDLQRSRTTRTVPARPRGPSTRS